MMALAVMPIFEQGKSMDTLKALTERVSMAKLKAPAPTKEQLDLLFSAALRAPDHARLCPWRFITIQGKALNKLGELFAKIMLQDNPDASEQMLERSKNLPLRAPMIVALILHYQEHPMVPEVEQLLSLGAAAHGLLTAAYQLGIGAYWRTGAICFDARVAKALHLLENQKLMGFIYLGTPDGKPKEVVTPNLDNFVSCWQG